jgi:Uncharacterized conserved protein
MNCNKKVHKCSIISTPSRPYLKWLKEGIKTAEGRVNTEKYRKIAIGDEIVFTDTQSGDYIRGSVIFKHIYTTFEEMLRIEGVKNMLPFLNDSELSRGIQVYESFPGAERVQQFGCVAIGLNIIESRIRN